MISEFTFLQSNVEYNATDLAFFFSSKENGTNLSSKSTNLITKAYKQYLKITIVLSTTKLYQNNGTTLKRETSLHKHY